MALAFVRLRDEPGDGPCTGRGLVASARDVVGCESDCDFACCLGCTGVRRGGVVYVGSKNWATVGECTAVYAAVYRERRRAITAFVRWTFMVEVGLQENTLGDLYSEYTGISMPSYPISRVHGEHT